MAVGFDAASTEYYRFATAPVSAYPVTISAWVYNAEASPLSDCVVQIQDEATSNNYLRLGIEDGAGNTLRIRGQNSSGVNEAFTPSGSPLAQNTWAHVCGHMATGNSRAYINGEAGTLDTDTNFFPAGIDSVTIGYEFDSSAADPWNGRLQDIAIWDVVLSTDEILMLAKGVPPTMIRPDSLVFYVPLRSHVSVPTDIISGTQGTTNGTPTTEEGPFVRSEGGILVPQYEEEQGAFYVGGAANGSATPATSGSVTHGLDIQAGDVILALVHVNGGTNTISDNNGANAFTEDSYVADLDHVDASSTLSLFTRVAGASEPASYSFNGWTSGEWSIVLKVFRGVDTSNHPTSIWSVAPASSGFTSVAAATSLNCANITLKKDEDIAVIFGGSDSLPFDPPTLNQSYENRVYDNVGRPVFGYHRRWPRGATSTPAFSWTGTNDMWALHCALKPAPDPRPHFVDGATATDPLATSITVTVSGLDIQADDVVIAQIHSNEVGVTILDNNGANSFTEVFQEDNPSSGGTGRYAIFSRVAGASEPTTYSFNYSGATDRITCNISVYRNVDTTDIWDVKPTALTRAFQSSVDFALTPLVQTNARNSMGLGLFHEDSGRRFVAIDRGYGNKVENASPDEACATFSNLLAFPGIWEVLSAEMSTTASGVVNHQVALLAADHATDARYIGFSSAGTAGATSVAVDVSALDIKEDDFILAVAHVNNNPTVTITNFTSEHQEENPTVSTSHIAFLYKVAGASEPSSYTFDWGTTERATCIIMVFRNINTTSPWEVAPSGSTRTQVDAATTLLSPSLTTTSDHTIGIAAFFSDAASVSFSGYSNGYFNEAEDGTPQEGLAVVSRPYYTPGNKGPVSATVSASGDIVAFHFALKEAAAGAPVITDVANSGETPGSGTETWQDGSTGNVISGSNFV